MSPPRGFGAELRIAARAGRAGERKTVAPAVGKIVEQDAAGIVLLRDRKADLQRARAVGWNGIRNLKSSIHLWRCHPLPPLCCSARLDASYFAMKAGDIARKRAWSIRPERVM